MALSKFVRVLILSIKALDTLGSSGGPAQIDQGDSASRFACDLGMVRLLCHFDWAGGCPESW